jgi:uncharacterized protein YhjY with autotransporter beta-barrel domain
LHPIFLGLVTGAFFFADVRNSASLLIFQARTPSENDDNFFMKYTQHASSPKTHSPRLLKSFGGLPLAVALLASFSFASQALADGGAGGGNGIGTGSGGSGGAGFSGAPGNPGNPHGGGGGGGAAGGGLGGAGNPAGGSPPVAAGGNGGIGGANGITAANFNNNVTPIAGGDGTAGSHGGNGGDIGGGGGGGGAGGYGAILTSGGVSSTNSSTILAGNGGAGGAGGAGINDGAFGGTGGSGGVGLQFTNVGATIVNQGSIVGGNGGAGGGNSFDDSFFNGPAGTGGTGIVGAGLSVANSGTISGGLSGDGARANAITFTGGTNTLLLQNGSIIVGNIAVTGNLTLDQDTNQTLTNNITGTGSVTNSGVGTLILSGGNLYAGGTTITAGSVLAAGSAGALGTGAVTNNGILETTATPIAGATTTAPLTLNVNGDYTQTGGATLLLQVASSPLPTPSANSGAAGTNYDTLNAGGIANLGGTLDLNFTGTSVPSQGQRYVVVSAGAPLTSEFALPTVTNLAAPYFTVITYNDTFNGTQPTNSAIVTILRPFTSFLGLTPNQTSVARNLDSNVTILNNSGALAMPSGAAADFYNNIVTGLNLSTYSGGLGRSLDELSPQRYEVLRNVAFDNYASDVQSLDNELARERYNRGGIDTSGFAFTDSALGPQLSQIKGRLLAWSPTPESRGLLSDSSQAVLGGVNMTDPKEMKEQTATAQLNRWNGFVDGGVDLGDLDHNSDASHASYTTGRVRGGIDYLVCDNFRVGALFGYAHTGADLDEEGSKANIDSYTPGIYAAYADKQGFYANGLFTYTRNDYSTQRDIVIPGVNRAATASPSGDQFGGDLDGGYEFHRGHWTFGPSAGLTYVNLAIDSFSESGAGSAGLSVNNQSSDSLRSRLGGTVRYQAKIGSLVLTPHLSAYWQHEFLDGSNLITSQFEGLPAGGFSVQTIGGDTDNALLSLGLDAEITKSVTLFIDYETEAGGANYFGQSASGGLKVGF